jgi:hypothetical protein
MDPNILNISWKSRILTKNPDILNFHGSQSLVGWIKRKKKRPPSSDPSCAGQIVGRAWVEVRHHLDLAKFSAKQGVFFASKLGKWWKMLTFI